MIPPSNKISFIIRHNLDGSMSWKCLYCGYHQYELVLQPVSHVCLTLAGAVLNF